MIREQKRDLFSYGHPRTNIPNLEQYVRTGSSMAQELKESYGLFTYSLITSIRKNLISFPADVLSVGDNWSQLNKFNPTRDVEIEASILMPNGEHFFIGNIIPRFSFGSEENKPAFVDNPLDNLLRDAEREAMIGEGVIVRLLQSVAIIDFTSPGYPILPDHEVDEGIWVASFGKKFDWGRTLWVYDNERPMIYHVTNFRQPI